MFFTKNISLAQVNNQRKNTEIPNMEYSLNVLLGQDHKNLATRFDHILSAVMHSLALIPLLFTQHILVQQMLSCIEFGTNSLIINQLNTYSHPRL